MKQLLLILLIAGMSLSSCAQNNTNKQETKSGARVGGDCEGCEAIYESPVAHEKLENMCWLPDWNEKGTKLAVNGIVYNADGTPAKDVVTYIYHTDQTGNYPTKGDEKGWGKRHGYLRGWMKTNEKGEYKFFTLRPASYPDSKNPQHIHVIIKEPNKNEYWIDEYLFDDDPFLTTNKENITVAMAVMVY
jgi:protocatechuate 3,4-dioxygenase, beta subunit